MKWKASLTSLAVCVLLIYTASANASISALTPLEYENRIVANINQIRDNHHLRHVKLGACADRCAERRSKLLRKHQRLYHQDMQILLERCNAEGVGEVLGTGKVSPHKMVRLWMNSPPHRQIILNGRYNRIGVGAVRDDLGFWWITADFLYQS